MSIVFLILPSFLILLAVGLAAVPWGAPPSAGFVLQVLPYMMAHLFLSRGKGLVPSPVVFVAGLIMDIASDGPLGFWALIYLFGVLLSRQLPDGLTQTFLGRISGLLLVIFGVAAAQVGVASLYQLDWINWHGVLAGTAGAGANALLLDLLWRERRSERAINVTARGGGRAAHV